MRGGRGGRVREGGHHTLRALEKCSFTCYLCRFITQQLDSVLYKTRYNYRIGDRASIKHCNILFSACLHLRIYYI